MAAWVREIVELNYINPDPEKNTSNFSPNLTIRGYIRIKPDLPRGRERERSDTALLTIVKNINIIDVYTNLVNEY